MTINLQTIEQDIAALPPEAQQIIFDLVDVLKRRYFSNLQEAPESNQKQEDQIQNWSDFIGCIAAEPDLSRNYKTYLSKELDEKYDPR